MSVAVLYLQTQLVTDLEVLAGRLDGAAITGRIEGRVRCQAPRLSQLEAKARGLSGQWHLGGAALFGRAGLDACGRLSGVGG